MSNPAWTPGPWFAVNCGTKKEPMFSVKAARIAGQQPRHEVAICATGDSPQEMETANAHLIAAAPELYSSLAEMLDIYGYTHMNDDELREEQELGNGAAPIILAARAALRKARGEAL